MSSAESDYLNPPHLPAVANNTHHTGNGPRKAGRNPDTPAAEAGEVSERPCKADTASKLGEGIQHCVTVVADAVQSAAGNIDEPEHHIETTANHQALCTHCNCFRVFYEDGDNLLSEHLRYDAHNDGKYDDCLQSDAVTLLNSFGFAGAEILTGVRGKGIAQRTERLLDNLLNLDNCRVGSNHLLAKTVNYLLQCNAGNGDCREHKGNRNADREGFADYFRVRATLLKGNTKIRVLAFGENDTAYAGKALRNDGSPCGSGHTHMKFCNKKQVEADIQECRNDQKDKRRLGISESAKKRRNCVVADNREAASTGNHHVGDRHAKACLRRIEKRQKRARQNGSERAHQKADRADNIQAVCDCASHILVLFRAEILRRHDADTGTDSVADGEKEKVDGAGRTDCCQSVVTDEFVYNNTIRPVIKLLEQISKKHRKRKPQNHSCRLPFRHVHYIAVISRHNPLSSDLRTHIGVSFSFIESCQFRIPCKSTES